MVLAVAGTSRGSWAHAIRRGLCMVRGGLAAYRRLGEWVESAALRCGRPVKTSYTSGYLTPHLKMVCGSNKKVYTGKLYKIFVDNHIGIPYRNTLSEYLIGIPYRNTISEYLIGIPYRNTFSAYLIGISYRNTLSEYLLGIPYRNTFSEYLTGIPSWKS
jgi:hypothetical protein